MTPSSSIDPGGWLMEQGESEKESCFSRSIRTYERDGLALIQGEIIDIENLPGGAYTPQIFGDQQRFQNGDGSLSD